MRDAASAYVRRHVAACVPSRTIVLPKLCEWYGAELGSDGTGSALLHLWDPALNGEGRDDANRLSGSVLRWCLARVPELWSAVQMMVLEAHGRRPKVRFEEYEWVFPFVQTVSGSSSSNSSSSSGGGSGGNGTHDAAVDSAAGQYTGSGHVAAAAAGLSSRPDLELLLRRMQDPAHGVSLRSQTTRFVKYRKVFSGADAVTWALRWVLCRVVLCCAVRCCCCWSLNPP